MDTQIISPQQILNDLTGFHGAITAVARLAKVDSDTVRNQLSGKHKPSINFHKIRKCALQVLAEFRQEAEATA